MDQITTSVDQITTSVDQITYLNYYSSGSKYYISGSKYYVSGSNFVLQKLMMHQMYDWNSYLVYIVHTDSSSCVFLHRNHNTKATGWLAKGNFYCRLLSQQLIFINWHFVHVFPVPQLSCVHAMQWTYSTWIFTGLTCNFGGKCFALTEVK